MQTQQPSVLFFQGMFSTFHQVRRAAGILFPLTSVIWPEEDLDEVVQFGTTWNPFYLLQMFFTWCTKRPGAPYAIRLSKVNIGQISDRAALQGREVRMIPTEEYKYTAFGISRGALTTFVYYATRPDMPAKLPPRFVLLEGCPDSIPNVLRYRYGSVGASFVEFILSKVTSYDRTLAETLSPLALVDKWPKDLPVAFVTSKCDTSVPSSGTIRLYEALKNAGHKHLHLLVLNDAHHNNYLTASDRDRQAYVQFVEELKKMYC